MANDMKLEFEEYIRELTQSISKEIFLEDLKTVCEKYENQLQRYEESVLQAGEAAEKVERFSQEKEADIKNLGLGVTQELLRLREATGLLAEKTQELLGDYSDKLQVLHKGERDAWIAALDSKMAEYETVLVKRLEKEYDALLRQLLEDFEKLAELNDVQYKDFEELVRNAKETYSIYLQRQETGLLAMRSVQDTLQQKMSSVEDSIDGIVKVQAEVLRQFSEKVSAYNNKEREKLHAGLTQLLDSYKKSFAEEISACYRQDMTAVYQEYEEQTAGYRILLQEMQVHNQQIQQFTARNIPALSKLSGCVEENLHKVQQTIQEMEGDYHRVFASFSEEVSALYETEREKFLTEAKESFSKEAVLLQKQYELAWQQEQEQSEKQRQAMQEYMGELYALQKELRRLQEKQERTEEAFHLYIAEYEQHQKQQEAALAEAAGRLQQEQEGLWQQRDAEWSSLLAELTRQNKRKGFQLFMMLTNVILVVLVLLLLGKGL